MQNLNKLEKDCELSIAKQPDLLSTALRTFGTTSTKAFKDLSRIFLDPSYVPANTNQKPEELEDDEAKVKAMEDEMAQQNLMDKIKLQIELEMRTNAVYKQSVQIRKMETKLERRKRQNEERKRAWEQKFDIEKQEQYEKVYRQYPELQHDEMAAKAGEQEKA